MHKAFGAFKKPMSNKDSACTTQTRRLLLLEATRVAYLSCVFLAAPFLAILLLAFLTIFNIILTVAGLFFGLKSFPANFRAAYRENRVPKLKYQELCAQPGGIRLLEIQSGQRTDTLQCRIVEGNWNTSEYEALSYTWACEAGRGEQCFINGQELRVSPTLGRALRYLRKEEDVRVMWIDAICINQKDNIEKSAQVQRMHEIYQHAQRVVVWLDVDSKDKLEPDAVKVAFDMASKYLQESSILPNRDWDAQGLWTKTIITIYHLPWWERMWIIQEVASNRNVIVQCRDSTLPWKSLCELLEPASTTKEMRLPDGLQEFVRRVEKIRAKSSSDPPFGLLALIHDFRYSLASEPRDRLYALLGLIRESHTSPLVKVDYSQPAQAVWSNFTKQCITKYGSLNALALADTHGIAEPSWMSDRFGRILWMDRRQQARDVRHPLWLGTTDEECTYSASGNSKARCRVDLPDPDIIGVQGFVYDTVDATGDVFHTTHSAKKKHRVLGGWKALAQAHLQNPDSLNALFFHTITAGNPTLRPLLQTFTGEKQMQDMDPTEQTTIASAIELASNQRRLITTRKTRTIGLANSRAQPGDLVCILFGSAVPYLLRRTRHDGPALAHPRCCWIAGCKRRAHVRCCVREHYFLVGQAYVHDVMQYGGDMESDIADGSVQAREFFLE